ncbi:MAG: hypothetical protein LBI41_00210 [Lactobacillales bacterium]|jgi:hypothetical protein|nr:hypothetical protein [Lactobacillales bacterium]
MKKFLVVCMMVISTMFSISMIANASAVDCRLVQNPCIRTQAIRKAQEQLEQRFKPLLVFLQDRVDSTKVVVKEDQVALTIDEVTKEVCLTVFIIEEGSDRVLGRATVNFQPTERGLQLKLGDTLVLFSFQTTISNIEDFFVPANVQYSLNQSEKRNVGDFLSRGKIFNGIFTYYDPSTMLIYNDIPIITPYSTTRKIDVEVLADVITKDDYNAAELPQEEEDIQEDTMPSAKSILLEMSRNEGEQSKYEVARKMKSRGLDYALISECTGLQMAQIERIDA